MIGSSGRQRRMVSLGKVTAPKPVNLPSQKKENNANETSVLPKSSVFTSSWGDPGSQQESSGSHHDAHGGEDAHRMPPRVIPAQPSPAWGGAGLPEERKKTLELASREQFPTLGAASAQDSTGRDSGYQKDSSSQQQGIPSTWDEDERSPYVGPPQYGQRQRREEHMYDQRDQYGRGRYGYHHEGRYGDDLPPRSGPPFYRRRPPPYYDEYGPDERGHYPQDSREYGSYRRDEEEYEHDERERYGRENGRYGYEGRPFKGGYYDHPRGERRYGHRGMNGDFDDRYGTSSPRKYHGGYREAEYHYQNRSHFSRQRTLSPDWEGEADTADAPTQPAPAPPPPPPPAPPPRKPSVPPPPPPPPVEVTACEVEEEAHTVVSKEDNFVVAVERANGVLNEAHSVESQETKEVDEKVELESSKVVHTSLAEEKPVSPKPVSAWGKQEGRPSSLPQLGRAPPPPPPPSLQKTNAPVHAPTKILRREQASQNEDGEPAPEKKKETDMGFQTLTRGGLEFDLGTTPVGRNSRSSSSILDDHRETLQQNGQRQEEVTRSLLPPSLQGLSLDPMSFGSEKHALEPENLITGSDAVNAAFRDPSQPPGLFTSVSVSDQIQGPPQPLMTFGTESSGKNGSSSLGFLLDNFRTSDTILSSDKTNSGPTLQFGDIMLPSTIDGCVDPDAIDEVSNPRKENGRGRGFGGRRGRGRGKGDRGRGRGKNEAVVAPPPPPPPPPVKPDGAGENVSKKHEHGKFPNGKPRRGGKAFRIRGTPGQNPPSTPPGLVQSGSDGPKGGNKIRKPRPQKPNKQKPTTKEDGKDSGNVKEPTQG